MLLFTWGKGQTHAADDPPRTKLPAEVASVLESHCIACHGPAKQKGGVRLDELDPDFVNGVHAEDWHDVLNAINLGQMPPKGQPALPGQDRRVLTGWITKQLKHAKEAWKGAGGQVVMRRLTRYEYNNTMADLLGVELDYAASLPPESKSGDGFENNGQTLSISPIQMEMYLASARAGLALTLVAGARPELHQATVTKSLGKTPPGFQLTKGRTLLPGQAFTAKFQDFPRQGVVRIQVHLDAVTVPQDAAYPRLKVYLGYQSDGRNSGPAELFAQSDVIPNADGGPQKVTFTGRIDDLPLPGHNPKFPGLHVMVAHESAVGTEYPKLKRQAEQIKKAKRDYENKRKKAIAKGEPVPEKPDFPEITLPQMQALTVKSIAFEGPIFDAWPPSYHRAILFDRPESMNEPAYAKEVIKRFIDRAYRRPATEADVAFVFDFYQTIRPKMPSFESAIRESLAMVLISPGFLYIVEPTADEADVQKLAPHELAARLSFFLWSTMPDAELRAAADSGSLSDPKALEQQVRRMLKDERSARFVEHFVGQWLDLPGVDRVAVNPQFYPDFDDSLKHAMKQETQHFFAHVLHEDLSALNLIDADFVMVNQPLAKHYGLAGPRGMAFQRVELPQGDPRGGLLTQASVLLMNSNGEDSHPIR